jgi:hypothetical protein
MLDLAAKYITDHSVEEFYEDIFVPALLLSEQDRHSGTLAEARQRFIFQAGRELIDELERQDEISRLEALGADARSHSEPAVMPRLPTVLGIAARDEADEVVADMLCHLLRRRGITAAGTPLAAPLDEVFKAADRSEVKVTFISALPPSAIGAARQMCRRLKSRVPDIPVLVGVWRHHSSIDEVEQRLHGSRPDEVVTTLAEAVRQIEAMLGIQPAPEPPKEVPPPEPVHERPALDDGHHPPVTPEPLKK